MTMSTVGIAREVSPALLRLLRSELTFDDVVGSRVVDDTRVNLLNRLGEKHGVVDDEVLELHRSGRASKELEAARGGPAPDDDDDER